LPAQSQTARPGPLSPEDERLYAELVAHFEIAHGNVSEVARAMGKARNQIHRWIKRFGIDLGAFRGP
jgi:transcriptional regulator of acetoin/glycerol metabolism